MSRSGWVLTAVRSAAAALVMTMCVRGAEPEYAPSQIRAVPVDQPESWPAGDWQPVPRATLDRFLQERAPATGGVLAPVRHPREVHYAGRFEQGVLRGTCRIQAPSNVDSTLELSLAPLSLRLHDLRWGEEFAVWGARDDGVVVVQCRPGVEAGSAQWEAIGRHVFESWEFDLQVPTAGLSAFELELPAEYRLTTSAGVVEGPAASADAGRRRWTVYAGRHTSLRLTCQPEAVAQAAATPLFRESHVAALRGDGVDLVSDFELAAGQPAALHRIELPTELAVVSMTVGPSTRVAYSVRDEGSRRTIQFAWPRESRESRLRLRCFGDLDWNSADLQTVPTPFGIEGRVIDRQLTVHVQPPLELQAFHSEGYRLVDRRSDTESIESWTFQAFDPQPRFGVRLAVPPPKLAVQTATWADYRGDVVDIRSRIRIQVGGGPTFLIRLLCPADWDVVSVAPVEAAGAQVTDFYHSPAATAGEQWLSVELTQPLPAGAAADFQIRAVCPQPRLGAAMPIPGLRLAEQPPREGLLAIVPPAGVEVASAQPSLASPPTGDRLLWLESLALGTPISDAYLFDLKAVSTDSPAPFISLEATTLEREPMSENSTPTFAAGARTKHEAAGAAGPRCAQLQLTTQLAAEGQPRHFHTAEFVLLQPFTGVCRFALDSTCADLELLIDGVGVPVVADAGDNWTSIDPVTAEAVIAIRYSSPASVAVMERMEAVVVPRWPESPPTGLDWTIRPAVSRACSDLALPFARVVQRAELPWTARLFGPLSQAMVETDQPVQGDIATKPAGGISEVSRGGQGVLRAQAAELPPVLQLQTWNPALTERAAWAVLMFTLWGGTFLRRNRWRWGRPLAPAACLALLATTSLAPAGWVRIAGGALVGLILTILLPRRMLRTTPQRSEGPPDRFEEHETRVKAPAAVSAGALVVAWGVISGSTSPGQDRNDALPGAAVVSPPGVEILIPDRDGEPAETAYVSPRVLKALQAWSTPEAAPTGWMIRSGQCDVAVDEQVTIDARFEVLVRRSAEPIRVRLPLSGVTFTSADVVNVDGAAAEIIPAAQEEAILINVSPPAVDEAGDLESTAWTTHEIVIRCHAQVDADGARRATTFQLPPAPTQRLRWSASEAVRASIRLDGRPWPPTSSANGRAEIEYKGGGAISAEWEVAATATEVESERRRPWAVSLIETSPLHSSARSWVELPENPGADRSAWSLPLGPGVTVQHVTLPPGLRWRQRPGRGGSVLDILALDDAIPSATAEITTIAPGPERPIRGQPLPLAGILAKDSGWSEWIAIQPGAGLKATVLRQGVPSSGVSVLPAAIPEVVLAQIGVNASEFHAPEIGEPLQILVSPPPTERRTTTDSHLELSRASARWSSNVVIDVTGEPTPVHRLQVDPRIQIDDVRVLLDGADRLARFVRHADSLELILARPYVGPLQVHLSGGFPISSDEPQPIPRVGVSGGALQSSIYQITNTSGWSVDVMRSAGIEPDRLSSPKAAVIFTDVDPDPPQSFRLAPGSDAVIADMFVQFLPAGESGWQQRILLDVRPQGVPLKQLRLEVPAQWQAGLRTFPAVDHQQTEPAADGWQTLVFEPSELRGGAYRVVLQSPLFATIPAGVWEYAPLRLPSALVRRRTLLLPSEFPRRPTSASGAASTTAVSPRLERLIRRAASLEAFEMSADAVRWALTPEWRPDEELSAPLIETMLWVDELHGVRGATDVLAVSNQPTVLSLQLPGTAHVHAVAIGGAAAEWRREADTLRIEIPTPLRDEAVSIAWRSQEHPTDGRLLELPRVVDIPAGRHLVAVVSGAAGATELSPSVSPLQAELVRMSALLTAAERQSTRTFALDSPLLQSLRRTNGRLEQRLRSAACTPEQHSEYELLRERWNRVHELIAVESELPGDRTAADHPLRADNWDSLADSDARFAVWEGSASQLRWRKHSDRRVWAWSAGLVAIFSCAWLLQRRERWERFADWLAERPELACLTLGGIWLAWLRPQAVGVVLVLAAFALWGRRRRQPRPAADTALIGPGR